MLLRWVAKLFALEPKANAIESGIIAALMFTALLASVLAVSDSLAAFYTNVLGDVVIGTR
jgi:Flp pilus assembly pilin Flp